ncbi:MAG TPA: aspartate ammonia-lyase [Gemmatimonadaceae bacterium]|jgi:aspartate ammonia-lyase|nr:aspartate ammonia-lyase [Gemmatimonadaceae bacterium]
MSQAPAAPPPSGKTRIEHDLLGDLAVPADAYYGVQTARAIENFKISGVPLRLYPNFIKGLAMVKQAAARANFETGGFSKEILDAIDKACQEIIDGKLHDQFVLDVLQGGAGTSTNMNANEVIANRALELMGHQKGEYKIVDPHDHVNRSQSTNDSYPTSMHIGMALGNAEIVAEFNKLIDAFRAKGEEFKDIVKMGRTQLQDAVPMTLGQEFVAFAETLADEVQALESVKKVLCEISMGGTAIGTGLNAPKGYAEKCTQHLAKITGYPIKLARNLIEATQDTQAFVLYSSVLKSLAIKLAKVGNDLRLLSSGPRCGLHEINLPATQPGSSIMPGKVNPVIPEVTNMVAYRVIGNDLVVTLSAEGGQLQLNAFEPVIAAVIFESQVMFVNAARTLRVHCVEGITANPEVCKHYLETSIGTVTALNPVIGYDKATELAAEALESGEGIIELVREKHILTDEQIDDILNPAALTGQGR